MPWEGNNAKEWGTYHGPGMPHNEVNVTQQGQCCGVVRRTQNKDIEPWDVDDMGQGQCHWIGMMLQDGDDTTECEKILPQYMYSILDRTCIQKP